MATNWLDLLSAAISGGVVVKLLDYAYSEYRRRSEKSESAKALANKHLDPILKAADELVGKLRSIALRDVYDFEILLKPEEIEHNIPMTSILYLIGQFWSRIQVLYIESVYVNLSASTLGKKLLSFIRTLESTRLRIVDRALQRGIGEVLIMRDGNQLRTMNYREFVDNYFSLENTRFWFQPLVSQLENIEHTRYRQRLLKYGAVIHALIDTLDPDHMTTRERTGWANKLTKKSRLDLRFRVFPLYLSFVTNPDKYYWI